MAICVPARDEAVELPRFVAALNALDVRGLDVTLCMYLDSCTDKSLEIIEGARSSLAFPLIVEAGAFQDKPSAGRARRTAMAMSRRILGNRSESLLLSTDADSRPSPNWLKTAVRALHGSDIVAGRITRIDGESDELQTRVERYYDRLYAYRRNVDPLPWDTNSGCHSAGAANLGFRASAYWTLGGFAPVAAGEDALILDEADRAGMSVRHEPEMIVSTSSRRQGRAVNGLSTALRDLAWKGLPAVTPPTALIWQYERHAAARRAFSSIDERGTREILGASLGLSGDHILGVARDCPNAHAFATRIVPAGPGHEQTMPLAQAEALLTALEATWYRGAA